MRVSPLIGEVFELLAQTLAVSGEEAYWIGDKGVCLKPLYESRFIDGKVLCRTAISEYNPAASETMNRRWAT